MNTTPIRFVALRLAGAAGFFCGALSLFASVVERDPAGVTVRTPSGSTRIQFWDDQTVRVIHGVPGGPAPAASFAVNTRPASTVWTATENATEVGLATAHLHVRIRKSDGAVALADAGDAPLLNEAAAAVLPAAGAAGVGVGQAFALDPREAIFGLGQQQQGVMNRVGTRVRLQQINTDVAIPVLLSSKGYLVLWDNAAITDVDVGAADRTRVTWSSEAGTAVDYYFCAGADPAAAIAGYRRLTGAAPLMPRWTWGFWQCRERYQTQAELLGVVSEYRRRGVPLDGIIQDWQYWPADQWGSHDFDAARYPDPTAMVAAVHAAHAHIIISVWPKFDLGTATLAELEKAGAVFPPVYPSVYPKGQNKWYDPYNPVGRSIYWRQISEKLFARGFDGWWLDASEPELGGNWGEIRQLATAAGPGVAVANAYPLLHTTGVHDGQRAERDGKRVFLLTRSAFAGQQRNGAVTWSGDIKGTWEVFRAQLPAGLNFVASGLPYWNTDIGGFFGGNPADPAYAELFTRWFQFGAFCPMFRVHGTNHPKELWRFDAGTQRILEEFIRLRYRLLPYIYSTSWQVTDAGSSLLRPLVLDFPQDVTARNVPDEFMFGPALLVAPVMQKGATSRAVVLPAGTDWYDYWTREKFTGGRTVTASAPINRIPLYVRAGSILPLGPDVQYADEKPDSPVSLIIAPGANGDFTLYDDAGDGYGYERREQATIALHWDDKSNTLTIGRREGTYPGMPATRQFHIEAEREGISFAARAEYAGSEMKVRLEPH